MSRFVAYAAIRYFRVVHDGGIDLTHHASCSFFRM